MESDPNVREVLMLARESLERLLETSLRKTVTTGACLYGSYLVRELVRQFAPGATARIRGGDGLVDGGCRGLDGAMHGHYWTEVVLADGTVGIADITGDQFGHAKVRWIVGTGAIGDYIPGNQAIVDGDVDEFEREIASVPVDHPSIWPFARECRDLACSPGA